MSAELKEQPIFRLIVEQNLISTIFAILECSKLRLFLHFLIWAQRRGEALIGQIFHQITFGGASVIHFL